MINSDYIFYVDFSGPQWIGPNGELVYENKAVSDSFSPVKVCIGNPTQQEEDE